MAASFGAETPILSYGPRAHADPGSRNDRVWVLWPAWAFRVVAPEFQSGGVNLLQKAVLGVLRASRLTAAELGERLGVHPDLAAFVATELETQGRIDAEWTITKRGIELIDEEREESASFVPGWVFRDPWNEGLWPFVAPSLEYAPTARDEKGYPILELGTTGKPWRQSAWMQYPPGEGGAESRAEFPGGGFAAPGTPDAHEILRAALRHKRLERRSRHSGGWEDEAIEAVGPVGLDLNRISSIEAEPEPVFLVSYLYVPRDGDDGDLDWHACDFFGRGSDPVLRRLVFRVADADEQQHLARRLDRLLGRTLHGDFDSLRQAVNGREHQARRLLDLALTIDVHRHGAAEPLAEVIEGWLDLRDLANAAGQWRRRGVLAACRRTLERLFREIADAWPLAGVADRLSKKDADMNARVLQAAADAVGLSELPELLRRVPKYQVRKASVDDESWRLRPLVAATLLRAADQEDHPLRSAAEKAPDLLARIERVTKRGGEAVHDGEDGQFDLAAVDTSVQETLKIAGLLLALPVRPVKEILRDGQE